MFLWYLAGMAAAISIAWVAAMLHLSGRAPIILTSLGVGVALGLVLGGLARRLDLRCPIWLQVGVILLSFAAAAAEHAWLYQDFRRQWQAAHRNQPELALFRPPEPLSPGEYFAREWSPPRAALWAVDAILIAAAAGAIVWFCGPPGNRRSDSAMSER